MTALLGVLDANVLYPASLRDLLIQTAFDGLFQARWTIAIEEEWARNLLATRPDLGERIGRAQLAMRRALPDALISGYEPLIADLALPDPDDRHVLAAAIAAGADVIVTFNLRDFPAAVLAARGIEALSPDAFLRSFAMATSRRLLASARACFGRLNQPRVVVADYLAALRRLGLHDTADFLAANERDWAG